MHVFPVAVGLMAMISPSAARTLHYTVPSSFKAVASNCTLPANFVVTGFTTYTDKGNSSLDTVTFGFVDADTETQATCCRNATSTPSGPSTNRYDCDNVNISFIYQTTGIPGLTVIERVCPGTSNSRFETSGLITPDLTCTDTTTGTVCDAKQESLQGVFSSFEPVPSRSPA